jgi:hypothetical protein
MFRRNILPPSSWRPPARLHDVIAQNARPLLDTHLYVPAVSFVLNKFRREKSCTVPRGRQVRKCPQMATCMVHSLYCPLKLNSWVVA